jgi:hypothetical protein
VQVPAEQAPRSQQGWLVRVYLCSSWGSFLLACMSSCCSLLLAFVEHTLSSPLHPDWVGFTPAEVDILKGMSFVGVDCVVPCLHGVLCSYAA